MLVASAVLLLLLLHPPSPTFLTLLLPLLMHTISTYFLRFPTTANGIWRSCSRRWSRAANAFIIFYATRMRATSCKERREVVWESEKERDRERGGIWYFLARSVLRAHSICFYFHVPPESRQWFLSSALKCSCRCWSSDGASKKLKAIILITTRFILILFLHLYRNRGWTDTPKQNTALGPTVLCAAAGRSDFHGLLQRRDIGE